MSWMNDIGSKIYRRLLRFRTLREHQWFNKSAPNRFTEIGDELSAPLPCPACGTPPTHQSDYPSSDRYFANLMVLYCTNCGLGYVPGVEDKLARYYEQDYALTNRQDRDLAPDAYFTHLTPEQSPRREKYALRIRRQLDLLAEFDARVEHVLDYGSGPGLLIWLSGAKDAHAVEPDQMSHKYLDYLGARVHRDHTTLPPDTFDTIVASHTIEHLAPEDLQAVLSALINTLQSEGRLLIEVPQGGHSYLRIKGERQEPHTLFFTGQSLVEAVRSAGGDVVFQRAMGQIDSPRREPPIYTPDGPPFYHTTRGSLTVICTKTAVSG